MRTINEFKNISTLKTVKIPAAGSSMASLKESRVFSLHSS